MSFATSDVNTSTKPETFNAVLFSETETSVSFVGRLPSGHKVAVAVVVVVQRTNSCARIVVGATVGARDEGAREGALVGEPVMFDTTATSRAMGYVCACVYMCVCVRVSVCICVCVCVRG